MAESAPPSPAPPRDRAWVEVRPAAMRRNLERLGELAGPGIRLFPVVKADAYGLGVERVLEALRPVRPPGYGVGTVAEGVELRRLGVRDPIMICAPIPPRALARAVAAGLAPAISDLGSLAALRAIAADRASEAAIPFQIEVDTGMGRSGFALSADPASDPPPWWREVRAAAGSGLRLFGVFTHLHSADAPDLDSARTQIARFDSLAETLRRSGGLAPGVLVHCANSAALLRLSSRTANAARPGVYLCGVPVPGAELPEAVVTVRARVVLVREVPAGATLGYGATYRAPRRERWAAAGIGYGDGLPRALGNRGSAIARGERVPIVGRVSMDTTVVRAPGDLAPGDVVTFVGCDGGAELSLEEVAEQAGTIPYEILTGLSRRLPRVSAP